MVTLLSPDTTTSGERFVPVGGTICSLPLAGHQGFGNPLLWPGRIRAQGVSQEEGTGEACWEGVHGNLASPGIQPRDRARLWLASPSQDLMPSQALGAGPHTQVGESGWSPTPTGSSPIPSQAPAPEGPNVCGVGDGHGNQLQTLMPWALCLGDREVVMLLSLGRHGQGCFVEGTDAQPSLEAGGPAFPASSCVPGPQPSKFWPTAHFIFSQYCFVSHQKGGSLLPPRVSLGLAVARRLVAWSLSADQGELGAGEGWGSGIHGNAGQLPSRRTEVGLVTCPGWSWPRPRRCSPAAAPCWHLGWPRPPAGSP